MKNARERMDVLAAYREVGTYRGAASMCGTTHKTVKRIVERHNAGEVSPQRKGAWPQLRRGGTLVAEQVKKTHERISAKRLLPAARTAGYEGSARNFRRLVASVKRQWRQGHHRGRRRRCGPPVIDWGVERGLRVSNPL